MTSIATSVVSAAVIGGELIIGLSDGSIINCGLVQGPQGLKGDQGPMGATGRSGTDGNTIHTVAGAPDTTLGRDGDYAINVTVWEIYGPRSGGAWGAGTPLRGNARGSASPDTTQNLFGSNAPGDGGGGGGIQQITGGEGIVSAKQSASVYVVSADIDTDKGLEFDNGKIAIRIGDGLEFDAATGALIAAGGTLQNTRTLPLVNPSIPDGLETQEDYRVWVYDVLSNLGQGEGGIETFPWIRIYMFKSERSTNWFYSTSWETNTNSDYTWQWEVDANNTGNFIDIAEHPQKTELGFDGREYSNGLFLNKIGQEGSFPNAKIRQRITSQINTSPVNELSTPIMQMWEIFDDVIDEPLYSKGESGGGGSGNPFATNDRVDVVQKEVDDLSAAQGTTLKLDAPNDVTTGFRIKNDSKTLISTTTTGELGLYHVKDPTDGNAEWAATKGYVDDEIAKISIPSIEWTPSSFVWEWGGNNDVREDPGTGKFQVSNDNKSKIALSATMANGIGVMNTFKSSNTYTGHKDRFCLWHEHSPNDWRVWFDGLIIKWDSASGWWHMELDPASYGRITSWNSGLYYAVGGPFA